MLVQASCRIADGEVRPGQAEVVWPSDYNSGEWFVDTHATRDEAERLGYKVAVEITDSAGVTYSGEAFMTDVQSDGAPDAEYPYAVHLVGCGEPIRQGDV